MKSLKKFIYLSIAAAFITITLKFVAWYMTDSVGHIEPKDDPLSYN